MQIIAPNNSRENLCTKSSDASLISITQFILPQATPSFLSSTLPNMRQQPRNYRTIYIRIRFENTKSSMQLSTRGRGQECWDELRQGHKEQSPKASHTKCSFQLGLVREQRQMIADIVLSECRNTNSMHGFRCHVCTQETIIKGGTPVWNAYILLLKQLICRAADEDISSYRKYSIDGE